MLLARFECPDKGAILVFIPMRQKQRGQCERKKKKVCTGCLSKFLCSVCTCADSTCEYFLPPPRTHALLFMIVAIVSSLCPLDAVSRVQQQDWLYERAKKTVLSLRGLVLLKENARENVEGLSCYATSASGQHPPARHGPCDLLGTNVTLWQHPCP